MKIYKKSPESDYRGKYIPKHKRGPDVELFRGQNTQYRYQNINKFKVSSKKTFFDVISFYFFILF